MTACCTSTGNFKFQYDSANDVFYLSLGTPRPSYGDDLFDGIIAMYDIDTNELTGVTILGYKRLVTSKDPHLNEIPINFDFNTALSF